MIPSHRESIHNLYPSSVFKVDVSINNSLHSILAGELPQGIHIHFRTKGLVHTERDECGAAKILYNVF